MKYVAQKRKGYSIRVCRQKLNGCKSRNCEAADHESTCGYGFQLLMDCQGCLPHAYYSRVIFDYIISFNELKINQTKQYIVIHIEYLEVHKQRDFIFKIL